ncbi:MAG: LysM peptidoglycan-binding domain-containing protein [Desulfobacteraceae bacterium]|nr:LysM peptidoglycan-binding domain-containing protein [Desulfobacteraceae bacterium]
MKNIKLVSIVALSIFIGACQHLNFITDSKKSTDNVNYSTKTIADNNASPADPVDNDGLTELNQDQTINENDIADSKGTTIDKISDEDAKTILINNQNTIDHALQIYRLAQKMWEEGDLNNALVNLDKAYKTILEIDPGLPPEIDQQKDDLRYMISKRILEIYASRHIVVNGKHDEIPIIMNRHVERQIKRFTQNERQFFIESLKRSAKFRPYMVAQLKKAGLPEELSWLPLVESGFKIRAFSSARALGLWQFIPSTGYKFGLKRNYYIDERLDPKKATNAAIAYLTELHKIFGDWTTALAAYNCGESRVLRTIRKQRINYLDNFWDLYEQLPRETSRYVPRFLATLHIINNLEKYNMVIDDNIKPVEYKTFTINKQVRLADIAKEIKVKTETLKSLNPELRFALLPPEDYELKIPADSAELFLAKLETIKTSYSAPKRYAFHRVRRGETLSKIARKYRTSVRTISRLNNIGRRNIIIAGRRLKVPYLQPRSRKSKTVRIKPVILPPGERIEYKVKSGDNLWIIARRYNTTTRKIMAASGINSTYLYINQTLYIPSPKTIQPTGEGMSNYWVKSGDSPFLIAMKHNMSLERFLALNSLTERSKIYPGQKLLVE